MNISVIDSLYAYSAQNTSELYMHNRILHSADVLKSTLTTVDNFEQKLSVVYNRSQFCSLFRIPIVTMDESYRYDKVSAPNIHMGLYYRSYGSIDKLEVSSLLVPRITLPTDVLVR